MRVKHLIVIVLDTRDLETTGGARALLQRYKSRGAHRPENLVTIWLDATTEEYKRGRQSEGTDRSLFGALNINRCEPNTSVAGLLAAIRDMMTDDGSVGVYVVGHGNGEYMTSNTRPIHVAILFHRFGIIRIDKLVILSCKMGQQQKVKLGTAQLSFVQALCYILAKCVPPGAKVKDTNTVISQYKGAVIRPKIAGWDAIVSTYFGGAAPDYTPAQVTGADIGRKVLGGGDWASGQHDLKLAYRMVEDGALQPLNDAGWSDKI